MTIRPGSVQTGMARRSHMAWDAVSVGPPGGAGDSALASGGAGVGLVLAGFIRPLRGGVLTGAGATLVGAVTLPGVPGSGPTPRATSIVAGEGERQGEAVFRPLTPEIGR